MRWKEEVELLKEEQRRVIAFMQWHADWWLNNRSHRGPEGLDDALSEGLTAYAHRQGALRKRLAAHFQDLWSRPFPTTLPADLI